jgi:hypothetical protein
MSRSPVLPFARWGIRLLLLPLVIVGATAHLGRTQGTTLTSGYLWQFLGPSAINGVVPSFGTFNVGSSLQNVTGRVTAVAIDPRTPAQIFVGAKGGRPRQLWRFHQIHIAGRLGRIIRSRTSLFLFRRW